ncbi:BF3164 family lipoprotein [Marinoscillum sp.]|uniref:BF3164 family lipoprotein n=1 Tax=Marinoscillum sp. TaxID=2024838 RepID=UPI003BAAC0D7
MNYAKLIPYLSILVLWACSDDTKQFADGYAIKYFSASDFNHHIELKGKKLENGDFLIPKSIYSLNDYVLVGEKQADTFLHIVNKKDYSCMRHVGVNGFGPKEIGMPWRIYPDVNKSNAFWALSVDGQKLLSYFDLKNSSPYPTRQHLLQDSLFYMMDFAFSSDTTLLGTFSDGESKFHEFTMNQQKVNQWGNWSNMVEMNWPPNVISTLYSGVLKTNEAREVFVLSSVKIDHLEVLNRETGELFGLRGPENSFPSVVVDNSRGYPLLAQTSFENKYGYATSIVTNDFIYALYSGYTRHEVDRLHSKAFDKVLKFSLKGEPLIYYQMDRQLIDITLDEERGILYGLTVDGNPGIAEFKLEQE